MSDNSSTSSPCGSFSYGEVEDYTINISTTAKSYDILADSEDFIDNAFTAYPNPARDMMNIRLADNTGAVVTFFNMAGENVMQVVVAGSDDDINISELPTGMYNILINDGQKQVVTKLIKQ